MRENLKAARKAAGLTQQQMADKTNVGLRHYKKVESGEITGSVSLWDNIEDILGTNQRFLRENHLGKEDSQ